MNKSVRRGAIVVLLLVCAACGSSSPTAPTATSQPQVIPQPTPTPPPAANFPPLSGPSRTFTFDRELSYPVSNYTKTSNFVLYDNGAFVLQYPGLSPAGSYRGAYTESNGVLTFQWEGWSIAGPWGATGTLKGNSLTVQYNEIMELTDFENAVYVRVP